MNPWFQKLYLQRVEIFSVLFYIRKTVQSVLHSGKGSEYIVWLLRNTMRNLKYILILSILRLKGPVCKI